VKQTGLTGEGGVFSNPEEQFGEKSQFNKEKYLPLVYTPFLISHMCCHKMKKAPLKAYQRQTKSFPILATMAEESRIRKQAWIRHGCNAFESSHPMSQPMSFWTEQDVLAYIVKYEVPLCPVYGDIVSLDAEGNQYPPTDILGNPQCNLSCTGCKRTGCVFCGFGFHNEKDKTRFQLLAEIEPRKYEYALQGGQWVDNPNFDPAAPKYDGEWLNWNPRKIWVPSKNGLGMKFVFDEVNQIYGKNFYRYE
jgi:3'-phosphoadenosine 5'-phosphosulfate sulfotransferase (PAPS reductase)/FAD synthetase